MAPSCAAKASPGAAQVFEGAQSGPRAIAVSAGSVYWTTDGSGSAGQVCTYVRALALLGSYVYWTTAYGLRRTTRAPFATGSITEVDSTASTVGLVADGTAVYFVAADGSVRRYAEGGPPVLLANGPAGALFIAQDDAAVYWTAAPDVGAGSIMMLAKPPE